MVRGVDRVIRPDEKCTICQYIFHEGDTGIVLIRVPQGSFDTVCEADWLVILASSAAWLTEHEDLSPDASNRVVEEAERVLKLHKRS